jgi:hypothetical protein
MSAPVSAGADSRLGQVDYRVWAHVGHTGLARRTASASISGSAWSSNRCR